MFVSHVALEGDPRKFAGSCSSKIDFIKCEQPQDQYATFFFDIEVGDHRCSTNMGFR